MCSSDLAGNASSTATAAAVTPVASCRRPSSRFNSQTAATRTQPGTPSAAASTIPESRRSDSTATASPASTSEAYGWLFKLLCDPGDEALVARPGYPLFDELARLEGVALRSFPLDCEGRWELDVGAVRAAIGARTRAVMLVHPNNPTGSFVSGAARDELAALCADRGLALVVDEVFLDWA